MSRGERKRSDGTRECAVEVAAPQAGSSRPTKSGSMPALGERRQEREQVPLRASDAADAVHVHDSHPRSLLSHAS